MINEVRENLHHLELLGMINTAYRDPGRASAAPSAHPESSLGVYEEAVRAVANYGRDSRRTDRAGPPGPWEFVSQPPFRAAVLR